MPIIKVGGVVTLTPSLSFDIFLQSGVIRGDQFGICDKFDLLKQLQFDTSSQTPNTVLTLKSGAISANTTITLPTSSGTLASTAFGIIQPPLGTSPTAASANDVLILSSSDGSVLLTGNASTKTVDYANPPSSTISASAIDWSLANVFKKTLSASTTFTFSNTSEKTLVVALTNTASNWTVTWPTVSWSGGSAPVQTIGAHTDVYTFIKIGSVIYGSAVQNF